MAAHQCWTGLSWTQRTVTLRSDIAISHTSVFNSPCTGETHLGLLRCTFAWVPSKLGETEYWGVELRHLCSGKLPSLIETAGRYHLTPVRVAVIGKTRDVRCWRGCGGKGNLGHHWREWKLEQSLQKTGWRLPRHLKI